jgi:hypothetical protein
MQLTTLDRATNGPDDPWHAGSVFQTVLFQYR